MGSWAILTGIFLMGSTLVTEHSFDRKATSMARFLLQETLHSANLAAGHTLRWFPSAILSFTRWPRVETFEKITGCQTSWHVETSNGHAANQFSILLSLKTIETCWHLFEWFSARSANNFNPSAEMFDSQIGPDSPLSRSARSDRENGHLVAIAGSKLLRSRKPLGCFFWGIFGIKLYNSFGFPP